MEYYLFYGTQEADQLDIKVRFSIFTIICSCAGLPALVWSVSDLIHHRKNGHRISAFITLLLLTDFVELFLSPYILIKYLLNVRSLYTDWTGIVFHILWSSSRIYGLLLNHLVALEGILSVRYPLYTAAVFSSLCFIIFNIFIFICIIINQIVFRLEYYFLFHLLNVFMFFVSFITWIISCKASCSADRHSHTSRNHHILVIFIFNMLVFYLPLIVFFILPQKLFPLWHIPWFLARVRLISDPLLCVLVCRLNLSIQTSQTPEGTSLV